MDENKIENFFTYLVDHSNSIAKGVIDKAITSRSKSDVDKVLRALKQASQIDAAHDEIVDIYHENKELNHRVKRLEWDKHQLIRKLNSKDKEIDKLVERLKEFIL